MTPVRWGSGSASRVEATHVGEDTDTLARDVQTLREGWSGKTPFPGTEGRQPY